MDWEKHLQDKTRIIQVVWFGAAYITGFVIIACLLYDVIL